MRIRVLGRKLLQRDGAGRFVLAAFVALLSLAGHAAQVDVSTTADLVNAIAVAQPGDSIVMRDGVWPDADILFSGNGTAANPITLRAATLGRVHLTGQSRLRLAGNFLVVDGLTFTNGYRTSGDVIAFQENSLSLANNSRLTNCAILYYNPPNPTNDTKWVSIYGFSNRVDNCYFEGKTNVGTTLIVWVSTQSNAPNYHVISRNRFGPRPALIAASNGGETIRIGTSDVSMNQSRTTVEDNFFDRCNGDAEFISNKSLENVYRRNTFYECEGALTLRHGNGCVVEGNYFFGNRKLLTGGVRIIGEDHKVYNNYFQELMGSSSRAPLSLMQGLVNSPDNGYFQVKRATVAFNTFVNCTNSFIIGLSGTLTGATNQTTTLPPLDCVIANNIVLQPAGKMVDTRTNGVNMVWEGNIFFGATLSPTNSGIAQINPRLVLGAGELWRPDTNSPALNAAQGSYSFVTEDFEGQARPGTKDVGCDQASLAAIAFPPLGATNVGPVWTRVNGTLLSWNSPAQITYGTPLGPTQLNASANAPGSFAYNPPAGTILSTGSNQVLTVVFTPTDAANFNVVTQSVTINVGPAMPVIVWTNPAPIVYGTALGAAQFNATINASGTFEFTPPAGTVLFASNGQALTVNFIPADTNQFLPASRTVFINVLKATPSLTWITPTPIEEGTPLSVAQLNATASVPGTFVYAPPTNVVLAAGAGQILSVTFTPNDTANYNSAGATVPINVTIGGKTVPTITWAKPGTILSGSPLGGLQLNASANVPGTFVYAPPVGTVLSAGNDQTLSVTFTPTDSVTYATLTKSVLIDVADLSSNALVRIAYVVPANRTPQSHAVASLQQMVLFHQKWFADQMEINGFGRKTFTFEPEPDGVTPFIHVLQVAQNDNELRSDLDGQSIINAVQAAGLPVGAPGQVWWLIPETHREQPDGAITGGFELGHRAPAVPMDSGWAFTSGHHLALYPATFHTNILLYEGITVPDIGPFPLVQDISFPWFEGTTLSSISSSALGAGLHSLGEAFGLDTDFRNDENFNGNVMGFGFRGIRGAMYPKLYPFNFCGLSYASALALDVNPFFNSGRLSTDTGHPSVTILTSGERSPVSGLLQINFRATDDRALHAALLTWETDSGFVLADERPLSGTNVNATFSIPYFNAEQDNRYTITAFDRQGNRGVATTMIYPRASVNRSPQPFVTTLPTVAGLGQDIVFDASGTFDPEHSANLLEVEWDFDGDGIYDTEPTTQLIVTNNYYTLGSRIVRARITDPAGAVAVSAPVAVNVTVCLTTLSPLTRFHGFAGSTGAVEVTVGPKCHWMVVNTNDWVVILSGSNGIGSGWVNYDVLPNPFFAERQGYLTIGDEVFLVRQHPVDCNFSISPTSRFHGFGVGSNSFKVTTKTDCAWFVINTNPWITITAGSNGVSTGSVFYALAENRVTGRRSGNIQVADKIFTVNQWGTNCEFVLSATSRTHSELSETGLVTVSTGSGLGGVSCVWGVENTNAWIMINASAGTNTGTFSYVVTENPSLVPRTGVITIANQPFTVSQEACSYSISPSSRVHTYLAQTGTVAVTAESICSWTLSNTNEWISIITYTNGGTGNATVKYSITANPTSDPRSATFTLAGYTFSVTQSGKPCLYTLEPEEFTHVETGGRGDIQVRAEPGCLWTVANPATWITILSGASGSSTGLVTYLVSTNDGLARHATLTIGEQEYAVSQASAVRLVAVDPLTVASGQINCTVVKIGAHGGESNLTFSLCFNTNLLAFTSAQLQSNSIAGATLVISNAQAAQGRVGFFVKMPAGKTMAPGFEPQVRVCFRGQNATGYPTTTLSMCDNPVARGLVDSSGRVLPASFSDGMATILGLCSLAESLDNTQLNFTIASGTWGCQTNVTLDGVDAAVNGPVADGSDARLEAIVTGPGTLSFWWKVSSEQDSDRLRFYLDDEEQLRISGEVEWQWRVFNLSAGTHELRWRYSKNGDTAGGQDRGWIDQILFEPLPPTITSHPVNQAVDEGSVAAFSVGVSGQGPFNYQWLFNGLALADSADIRGARTSTLTLSNVPPARAGIYSVIVGNSSGNLVSQPATLSVTPAMPLPVALDATNLIWLTSGSAPWIGQPVITLDGVDAGRSGVITHGQTTTFETTIEGPGTLSFWWKVSSETNNDRLVFFTNSVEQARISGEVEWEQRTFTIGPGARNLRWSYSKSTSVSSGADRAWVDRVEFTPTPVTITAQPVNQIVDSGTTAFFAVSAAGTPPFTYQWRLNGGNLIESATVRGTKTATLTLSNVAALQGGSYSVVVGNSGGSVVSSNALLQINQVVPLAAALDANTFVWSTSGTPPWVGQTATSHDGADAARSGRIGDGLTTSFQTTMAGPGVVSFWWKVSSQTNGDQLRLYVNNVQQQVISGEVDWTWRTFSIGPSNSIIEWRYVKNASVSVGDDRGWVDEVVFVSDNVPTAPFFAVQPISREVVAPGIAQFAAIAGGSSPLSYQWYFNGTPLSDSPGISGTTTTNLLLTGVDASHAGTYYAIATNSSGTAISASATLTAITAPVITTPPVGQHVVAGSLVSFNVTALGQAPLTYQWMVNGTNILNGTKFAGATTSTLLISNVQAAQAGLYSVLVSNAAGTATSLEGAGSLTTWIAARTGPITNGQSTALEANVTGPGTIRFAWKVSSETNHDFFVFTRDGFEEARISGETDWEQRDFVIPPGPQLLRWQFSKDASGSTGADAGFLDEVAFIPDDAPQAPVILNPPPSQSVVEGTTVVFNAALSGTPPLSYGWRRNGVPLQNGDRISGAHTPRLTLSSVQFGEGGQYSLFVSNAAGTASSAEATLAVNLSPAASSPVIVTAPASWDASENAAVTFTVDAVSALPLSYRWLFNNVPLADGAGVTGATTATLTLGSVHAEQSGNYSVIVSNATGAAGANAALMVRTLGDAAGTPYLAFNQAGNASWIVQANVTHNGGLEAVRSGFIGDGENTRLEAWVEGPGTVSYWWKVSSEPVNDQLRFYIGANTEVARISGEVDWQQLTFPVPAGTQLLKWRYGKNASAAEGQDAGWVDDIVYTQDNITTAPFVTNQPVNINLLAGTMASMSAGLGGSMPISFQWYSNGVPMLDGAGVRGAKAERLIISKAPVQSASYTLWASNAAGIVVTEPATLTVTPISAPPAISTQPVDQNVIEGSTVNFSVLANGDAPLSCQWHLNGVALTNGAGVSGATSTSLTLQNVTLAQAGTLTVVVSNQAATVTSRPAALAVTTLNDLVDAPYLDFSVVGSSWLSQTGEHYTPGTTNGGARLFVSVLPSITTQPSSRIGIAGSNVVFDVDAGGSAPLTYQWRYNGINLTDGGGVSGATTPTLTRANLQPAAAGSYSVVVNNAVGVATSSNAVLTVLSPPVIIIQPSNKNVAEGASATLTVTAIGTAPLSYRWSRDGTNLLAAPGLSGVNSATLILSNAQLSQSGTYSVAISNAAGTAVSSNAIVSVIPPVTLDQSVNAPYLQWSTSANAPWLVQSNFTHDGETAAQSGAIPNSGSSWIETTVTGPGTIRFWWKVSSQTNADAVRFSVGNAEWAEISGDHDWEKRSFDLPPGTLALRWTYEKNSNFVSGFDRAWLDEVDFIPVNAPSVPVILTQPIAQDVPLDSTVTLSVEALGSAPLTYQWRNEGQSLGDGGNVLGANSPTLRLFNVTLAQAGLYDVVVRNPYSVELSEKVLLNVLTTVSLPVALDTDSTNFFWRTGGFSPWLGQTSVSVDQFDAAQSSPVGNNATNWLQTVIPGPCALTFWWKVSSQTNSDRLRFLVDGVERANISGEVNWQQRSFPIETATATVRWEYAKNASGVAGQDRGWVDRIETLAISPRITNAAPNTNIVDQGTTVRFKVDASGTEPLLYQWRYNGSNLVETPNVIGATTSHRIILSNAQPNQTGFYVCQVANSAGEDISEQLYLRVNPAAPIGPAVNATRLVWATGGYSWFVGTTDNSHNDSQSVRNGYVDDGFSTWMNTTVVGPGTLTFWWSASTQPNADFLRFSINGVLYSQISGNVGWQQQIIALPPGPLLLQWEYAKDALLTNGEDRVWIDDVSYVPTPPAFAVQPASQAVDVGSTVIFAPVVTGGGPPVYRWRWNGTTLTDGGNISGATSAVLRITGVLASQVGTYSLFVTNLSGTATSSNAALTVTPTLPLQDALDAPGYVWVTNGWPWVGQPAVTHDGVDAARSPATLGNSQTAVMQTTVTGPGGVSFWWKVSSETNGDALLFLIDSVEQARISGEVDWQQRSFNVPEGNHLVKFYYAKNGGGAAGQDRGWVDQFAFTLGTITFNTQPVSQIAEIGARIVFTGSASGLAPLSYQWTRDEIPLSDGVGITGSRSPTLVISNAQPSHSGTYALRVNGPQGEAKSADAVLGVSPPVPLADALDGPNLVWTVNTNSNLPWVGQINVSFDGEDAARSGTIGNNGSNHIQTVITGPGTLRFAWAISSEPNNDNLIFSINNLEVTRISGESPWNYYTFDLASGSQTCRWAYVKNGSIAGGQDMAWVDQVYFGPAPARIATQPTNQMVDLGGTNSFRVTPGGTPPFTYQWQFEGTNLVNGGGISGVTTSNLTLNGVQLSQSGSYRVVVSNSMGSATSSNATLTVFTNIPLAVALDTPGLVWTTNGAPGWVGHGAISHDGVDAARSPIIPNSASAWMEATVAGPITLSFWWRVSSEPNDRLRFSIDGQEQESIGGETNWLFRTYNLGPNNHPLRWTYTKSGSNAGGQDRGWVDQVTFGVVSPTITAQPTNRVVDPGQSVTFSVTAAATPPLFYRWYFNGAPLTDGSGISGSATATLSIASAQSGHEGNYFVIVSNASGTATSSYAGLALIRPITLNEALDNEQLTFTNGGTSAQFWIPQQATTHDGVDAAQTGTMTDSTYTFIKANVTGPGLLTFWWKVSSEQDHDFLRFMLDAVDQVRISGESNWHQITFNVPANAHELQWRFSRSPSGVGGQNRAWLDQVSYTPNAAPVPINPPSILIQPVSQTVDEFETATFTVAANGATPLSYQWFFNGTNVLSDGGDIGGVTTEELTLFNVRDSQGGTYSVVVTNVLGSVTSVAARLTVNHILTLAEALDVPDWILSTDGDAFWQGNTVVTHDGAHAARSGLVQDGETSSLQTIVDGPGWLSFWWRVSSETNADMLVFSVNGETASSISGEPLWQQFAYELLPGPQFVDWTYFKNDSVTIGDDRGWVDQVLFVPASGLVATPKRASSNPIRPRLGIVENKVQLTWTARTRNHYEVYYKDNLADPEWKLLDSEVLASWKSDGEMVQPDNYAATVEDLPGGQARFYLVLEY